MFCLDRSHVFHLEQYSMLFQQVKKQSYCVLRYLKYMTRHHCMYHTMCYSNLSPSLSDKKKKQWNTHIAIVAKHWLTERTCRGIRAITTITQARSERTSNELVVGVTTVRDDVAKNCSRGWIHGTIGRRRWSTAIYIKVLTRFWPVALSILITVNPLYNDIRYNSKIR